MDEKLIVIDIEGEIIDSFIRVFSELGLHFYCIDNGIVPLEVMEFCSFVYVSARFK